MKITPDPIYSPENVPLFEAIYGKRLISLGGHAAIDNMFCDLRLSGLNALDVGFGLGGVAFYLAKKYQMAITGIEVQNWMVDFANANTPPEIAHLLQFAVYNEAGKLPFNAASFDLAYSKGVLNHVHDKTSLFTEIYRVLKPAGLFVIADWIYPGVIQQDDSSPLVKESETSYKKVLSETGFTDIHFRDDSSLFLGYVKKLLENIQQQKTFIENKFSKEIFSIVNSDHVKLIDNITHHRQVAVRIIARKK